MRENRPSRKRSGDPAGSPVGGNTTRDELFRALAHARRRRVLAYLRSQQRAVPVEHVATHVATAETTGDSDAPYTEVETALYHVHLPKLIDVGLVTWADPDRREAIRLTTLGKELPTMLDWVPGDLTSDD